MKYSYDYTRTSVVIRPRIAYYCKYTIEIIILVYILCGININNKKFNSYPDLVIDVRNDLEAN